MSYYTPVFQEHVRHSPLELEQLLDQEGVLTLTLSGKNGYRLILRFDSHMSYRKLDEGDALITLSAIRASGGTGKYFYQVDNSDFISWFNAERCGPPEGEHLSHYLVAASNDLIDVLSFDPPNIWQGPTRIRG